ncbi:hypothetical protein Bhyg_15418, partial [Pseudolycoriella hygida]
MATKPLFFNDTHPRIFPKDKNHLEKFTPIAVTHAVHGISTIIDKKKTKNDATKKSFKKWKQQHDALFTPVKFEETNRSSHLLNKKNPLAFNNALLVNKKFDVDFQDTMPHKIANRGSEQSLQANAFKGFFSGISKQLEYQSMMTYSQLNRAATSERSRFDESLKGRHDSHQLENTCPCTTRFQSESIENYSQTPCNDTVVKEKLRDHHQSNQEFLDGARKGENKSQVQIANKALVKIVEDQIDIVEQQKQILQQQNEIFKLQHQIEKLVLMSRNIHDKSAGKQDLRPSISSNARLENKSQTTDNHGSTVHTAGISVGVMTSFNEYLNEKISAKKDSHEDTMLERINKIIKNSPSIVHYKSNNGNNCRSSTKEMDVGIESQTVIYKASTRNQFSSKDPKIADRSYALQLLEMKYNPNIPTSRSNQEQNVSERTKCPPTDIEFVTLTPD